MLALYLIISSIYYAENCDSIVSQGLPQMQNLKQNLKQMQISF